MNFGEPEQLALDVEEPFYFLAYAPDGTLVDAINVNECTGGWHEAALWAWLAVRRYAQSQEPSSRSSALAPPAHLATHAPGGS